MGGGVRRSYTDSGKRHRPESGGHMDHMTIRIGAVWMVVMVLAAAFLGTEFILQEIHSFFEHRRDSEAE